MNQKPISELEQKVMNIVWQQKVCSVKDVLAKVAKERKFAYTTIATVLQRLERKGLVKRSGGEGFPHLYKPIVSKELYMRNIAKIFLKKFIHSFGDTAIASFAESIEGLPQKKRKYFLGLLEEYGKDE